MILYFHGEYDYNIFICVLYIYRRAKEKYDPANADSTTTTVTLSDD